MSHFILRSATCLFCFFGALSTTASSHYLWVDLDQNSGEYGTINVFYEGGPGPGDGQHLDPFIQRGSTWIRTLTVDEPVLLKMNETTSPGKRWLSAPLTAAGPRSLESYGKWGVYRYGQTDVLLHYYAKHFDVSSRDQLNRLGRARQLDLDIAPVADAKGTIFQVLWKGKPVAGRPAAVRGPGGFNARLTTDKDGRFEIEAKKSGRYTIRTSVEQKMNGTDDGKEFQLIRHHGTALLHLPIDGK